MKKKKKKLKQNKQKKTEIIINKSIYLGLSILELMEILMHKFWHDQVKPKYDEKQNYVIRIQSVSLST